MTMQLHLNLKHQHDEPRSLQNLLLRIIELLVKGKKKIEQKNSELLFLLVALTSHR